MKALVVDPSRVFQEVIAGVLRDAGGEAIAVYTGAEGLRSFSEVSVDLACVAYHLPDMDGVEFCRQLRALSKRPHVPVVLLTSSEDSEVVSCGLQAGITEAFRKSEFEKFVAYVQELKARRAESLQLSGRVLLVEDSASVRAMVRGVLERTGLEVDLSADANRAWALFTEEQHDLVLTDVLLAEGTTGLELVRRIRHAQGRKSRTPVLAMSAFEDAVRKVELLEYGANDFIGKPVLPEELVARVRNLIANKQLLDKVEMQQEYLRALAATDHLTSLYNRRFLAEVVPMSLASARRHGYSLSLLMIDLDHFKAVNDRHGHSTGDCVLVETAKLLRANCRKEDLAARIGGEEFVLLLSHCGLEQATAKAERLRRQIEELEPAGIHLTASLGVATLVPESGESFEVLFAAADKAVYSAKAAGRNCVRITGASPEVPK